MKFRCGLTALTLLTVLTGCTKDTGKNPALAYSDLALLDSCRAPYHQYYKNDPEKIHSGAAGSNGQHGAFKLRFNAIAFKALQDSGKLPVKKQMPEGALIIKDIYNGNQLTLHAIMYKYSGSWIWAEIQPNELVLYSVTKNPGVCVSCHSQQGNRDFLRTFNYY